MFRESVLSRNFTHILWESSISGVQVCQFDLSVAHKVNTPPLSANPVSGDVEILFCQSGHLLVELAKNRLLAVEEQEILLISDPAQLRSFQTTGNLSGILVSVEIQTAREYFLPACSAVGLEVDVQRIQEKMKAQEGCMVLSDRPWTQVLFEHLERLSEEAKGRYVIFKVVELLYLLCMKSANLKEDIASSTGGYIARSITDARAYMENHLAEKLTISDLSDRFSISPTSLKSGFRRMYGTTLHHWLVEQRMKRARELLQSTDMTIQQIAQMVGYDGVSQFNVTFKRHYGVTPGQFAKMSETIKTCPFH